MDDEWFGMTHRPFRPMPDAASYYPATGHELAFATLQDALECDEGIVVLVGEPGVGKSLLAQRLADSLPDSFQCAYITHARLEHRADLLRTFNYDLGLPHEQLDEHELRLTLTDHILKHYQNGERTLLLIDEAHHLPADLLEELRLLSNLSGSEGYAVQVVLIGLPRLLDTLQDAMLDSLRQRIAITCQLPALEPDEVADYIVHHLRVAGGRPERIITADALAFVAQAIGGVPRMINRFGTSLLKRAMQQGLRRIDRDIAIEELNRSPALVMPQWSELPPVVLETPEAIPMPEDDDDGRYVSLTLYGTDTPLS